MSVIGAAVPARADLAASGKRHQLTPYIPVLVRAILLQGVQLSEQCIYKDRDYRIGISKEERVTPVARAPLELFSLPIVYFQSGTLRDASRYDISALFEYISCKTSRCICILDLQLHY